MSQVVGHFREATKDFTAPKMNPGFISSATKFSARNFSGGVNAVSPLACRSAVALALAAQAVAPLPSQEQKPQEYRQ